MSNRLLRLSEVRTLVPLSKATIYNRIREGTFPAPVKIGVRASAWQADAIERWCQARIAAGANAQTVAQ